MKKEQILNQEEFDQQMNVVLSAFNSIYKGTGRINNEIVKFNFDWAFPEHVEFN